MPKILNHLSWWFIILFAVPTVFIMGSWNSLPGEPMYGVKQAFERGLLLAAKPSYATQGGLSVTYTERRFAEATTLLSSKHSVEGLPYLEAQVEETKQVITRAPNKESQQQLARDYVATLKTVHSGLEQQKQALISERSVSPASPPPPTKTPTRQMPTLTKITTTVVQPTPTRVPLPTVTLPPPQPPPAEIVKEISKTQEQIEEAIKELEEEVLQSESQFREEKRAEKKDQEKDKGDKDRGRSEEHRQDDKEKKDKEKDGDDKKND